MASCDQTCPTSREIDKVTLCFDSNKYLNFTISYDYCEPDRIGRYFGKYYDDNYGLNCRCINNVFVDCVADLNDNKICKPVFPIVIAIQTMVTLTALTLNGFVCFAFCRRKSLRKEYPAILLFHQALADIANCVIFAIPNEIFLMVLYAKTQKKQQIDVKPIDMFSMIHATIIITASSSIFLFAIIAIERFLALYKPLWHRVRISRGRIWKSVGVVWLMALILAGLALIFFYTSMDLDNHWHPYKWFLFAVLVFFLALVTVLYIFTFTKAYRAVHSRHQNQIETTILYLKKELRLIVLFMAMYLIFILGIFAPLIAIIVMDESTYNLRSQLLFTLFTLTSVFNPALTLYLKPSFRVQPHKHSRNYISSSSTTSRITIASTMGSEQSYANQTFTN